MRVISVEHFDRAELLARLREVRLAGYDGARPYEHASLELELGVDPELLVPAQRYILLGEIQRVATLRSALLEHGVDLFQLDGGVRIRTEDAPDDVIPVIPPIVEESHEPDGRTVALINDGMHRVYVARTLGQRINTVMVRGVPPEYPYYALALPGGWSNIVTFDELPDGFEKKVYRQPDGYRALFRDFNGVFPGVQQKRKNSNPGHLRA